MARNCCRGQDTPRFVESISIIIIIIIISIIIIQGNSSSQGSYTSTWSRRLEFARKMLNVRN